MTEDEAKTKWCPHAVASHTNPRAGFETSEQLDGLPPYPKTFACIASACMAWRWIKLPYEETRLVHEPGYAEPVQARRQIPGDGYCGLAGASA